MLELWHKFDELSHPYIVSLFIVLAITFLPYAWIRECRSKGRITLGIADDMGDKYPYILVILTLIIERYLKIIKPYLLRVVDMSDRWLDAYGIQVVVSVSVVLFGIFASSWSRQKHQSYGVTEIIFGITAIICLTFSFSPDNRMLKEWIGLGSAAYVIARGLNNVAEAKERQHKAFTQAA